MTEDHYLREKIRQTLATDPHVGILNVRVQIDEKRVILYGEVSSTEKGEYARTIVQRQMPDYEVISELTPAIPPEGPPEGPYVRIAAAGDLHYDALSQGKLRSHFQKLEKEADLLLLAGDLTDTGTSEEAAVLVEDLKGLQIPIVAVLGNHDYHCNQVKEVGRILEEEAGVTVLEGDATVLRCRDLSIGIAGTKGFGGGFEGACGTLFGEPEMKAFIAHTEKISNQLKETLLSLRTDLKIALLHYSPIRETLAGERAEVFPFLGSYLLGKAIDEGGADLVVHGHSHHGRERGMTRGGIPVRNAAIPMLKKANLFYSLSPVQKRHILK